jgi:hypothetical protein
MVQEAQGMGLHLLGFLLRHASHPLADPTRRFGQTDVPKIGDNVIGAFSVGIVS